ncbi:MAG: hypothetical protein HY973_01000 [Candidatus Kerfeldbacteria bacterium]|nr:hypothetical protein [Candidatus Kerfeldbacteria bacterium]
MNTKRSTPYLSGEILRLISYCPLCEAPTKPLRARILEDKAGGNLIHLQCANCHSSMLALVVNSPFGITSIGLITDLTSDDVLRFKDKAGLTADEVLEVHQLLYKEGDK